MEPNNQQENKRRPHSIFKPKTRKPNFAVSIMVAAVRLFAVLVLVVGVVGVGVVLGIVKAYTETAPELNLVQLDDQAQTSFFYDAQGNVITDYKGTEDRVMVSIDDIPEMLQYAFVAVEDARFFSHNGVDVKRIVGAFVSNLSSSSTQGGSTITQQLLKKTLLSDEQSYKRKIQEAYLAMQLENVYTKEQILESYLNTIYLGESYYGVKTAAYGYFGKELDELTLRECAMLAGVARSPYYYNPRRNFYLRETPDVSNNRTDYGLRQMLENQFITEEQYEQAMNRQTANVLEKSPNSAATLYDYPYYVEYAINDVINEFLTLNSLEDTKENRAAMQQKLRTGGYHVYLCIDPEIQKIVEDTLTNWGDYPQLRDPGDQVYPQKQQDGTYIDVIQPQAAMAIMDYRTGELKAVVGGRTQPEARMTISRATDMNMPVGSSIKPIAVYAPALEGGQSPASIVYNMPIPIHGWNDGDGKDYFPSNYGGGGFTGPTTLRRSLRQSYNVSAAQTLTYFVGVDRSAEYLQAMGVDEKNIKKTAFGLALGSSGITPVQMTAAFSTLANGGVYQQPISFSRVEDSDGNVIINRQTTQVKRIVFRESTAWMTVDMMKDAVASGTGTSAQIKGQTVAGKTGTNSDARGITFAGMTGWYAGSVWIGHDAYKPLSAKATGGNYAAPLWQAVMEKIHTAKGLDNREIIEKNPEEMNMARVTTCGVSGMLATAACSNDVNGYGTVTDYWNRDDAPQHECNMHQQLNICSESGMYATEYCPNPQTKSVVIIPIGHPMLYDYISEYQSVMSRYLGEFATLMLTTDDNYNNQLVQSIQCNMHSQYNWQEPGWGDEWGGGSGVSRDEAYSLVSQAYELLNTYSGEMTGQEYVSVSFAIREVEAILSGGSDEGLAQAVSNLRYALSLFGW